MFCEIVLNQKSELHELQCHCFPIFLLANPNIAVEAIRLTVPFLDVFVEWQYGQLILCLVDCLMVC